MIGCLISVIIIAIVLVIILIIVERLLAAFGVADARIVMLIRLLFGLLILLYVLSCLGIFSEGPPHFLR